MKRVRVWGALWGTCLVFAFLAVAALAKSKGPPGLNIITEDTNTAIGVSALESNIIGDFNTASGVNALQSNTTANKGGVAMFA